MRSLPISKIFLSSTFTDLSETRAEVSAWLTGVFGTELLIMETFGSDAAPPEINSVRRVRECDLFIGIYAHRYGTVDQSSGKSITELELDEAKRSLSTGSLSDILLYVIDDDAPWPQEHKETGEIIQAALRRLREKAKQHTFTYFKTKDDLLFYIIRDVYRRLSRSFGAPGLRVRGSALPSVKKLRYPIGMEFLSSEHRNYLIGREKESKVLLSQIEDQPIVLLVGDSGVGKSSVIHAGLFPRTVSLGWRIVYTRPLGFPYEDIVKQIESTVFESGPSYRTSLMPLLGEVTAAVQEKRILIVIDQFEDVLIARDSRETEKLVSDLRSIRELATPSLHVLISYRADLEGRLGEYWQKISGSPQGLPRVYLGGVNKEHAWAGIAKIAKDLQVNIRLTRPQKERIKTDLLVASRSAGFPDVYPPYVQMLIDHMWSSSKKAKGTYLFKYYQDSGAMEGVIGGYLNRQLEYAQDREGHVQAVLVSLVRSYGVKAQRSIDEIVSDTGLARENCETALKKLIDLRLVRHIETYFEISHDFIAKKIMRELVDSEEREFKRFRELLSSKAAAYHTTEAPLAHEEILMLYKHKERVVPNDLEVRLLLSSWVQEKGPALYWLLNTAPAKTLDWLRAEESKKDVNQDQRVSVVLLQKKLGKPMDEEDFSVFRSYQLSAEMAALISDDPLKAPTELLLSGLRHRREEVRDASRNAIALRIKHGEWSWIERLRKSSSVKLRQAYEEFILRDDIPIPAEKPKGNRATEEFLLLKKIAVTHSSSEAKTLFKNFQEMRSPARSLLFGRALAYIKQGRIKTLIKEAERTSKEKASVLLSTIRGKIAEEDFKTMLSSYQELNSKERERHETYGMFVKANALAAAVFRVMSNEHLPLLRKTARAMRFTSSARGIILALLKHGSVDDLRLVLERISEAGYKIDFWNHTELGRVTARRMEKTVKGVPKFLLSIFGRKEFWEFIPREERSNTPKSDLLPINDLDNRALYVRLAAYAIIGAAGKNDQEHLISLAAHGYGLIARAAAIRLVRLSGETALRMLSRKADESIQKGRGESLAGALRSAEIELFGLASFW